MATVVVFLPGTCRVSSTPTPAVVMIASVVRGVISETEPTSVVLPTPNPPAMTIFADVTRPPGRDMSEPAKSTEHPLQQFSTDRVVLLERSRLIYRDKPVGGHICDKNARYSKRELHARGYFCQRLQPAITQRRNLLVLPAVRRAGLGAHPSTPN